VEQRLLNGSTEQLMDVQQVLAGAQETLTVRRVFGDPIHAGGTTIVPAALVRGGGGAGGRNGDRGGVGFGLQARPAGVFVIQYGEVSWRPAVDVNRIVLGGQLVAITALLVLRPLIRRWTRPARSLPDIDGQRGRTAEE
jgi:hypothetical protein